MSLHTQLLTTAITAIALASGIAASPVHAAKSPKPVEVVNFPEDQEVSGTMNVANLPDTADRMYKAYFFGNWKVRPPEEPL